MFKGLIYNGIDYSNMFEISDIGEFKRISSDRILKTSYSTKSGYEFVSATIGYKKVRKIFKIHKAVAETYLLNNNKFTCVNHKDGNKMNNTIENLEWVTSSYNTIHAMNNNLLKLRKQVQCVETNEIYISQSEAARQLGTKSEYISKCCRNSNRTCLGKHWRFI